jgi:hypothetical protein
MSQQHASFIGCAIVEMLLLLISIIGFVGAIVRKLTLAATYAIVCIRFSAVGCHPHHQQQQQQQTLLL